MSLVFFYSYSCMTIDVLHPLVHSLTGSENRYCRRLTGRQAGNKLTQVYYHPEPLENINQVFTDMKAGRIDGRTSLFVATPDGGQQADKENFNGQHHINCVQPAHRL